MFRVVNEYMSKLNIVTDDAVQASMEEFLSKSKSLENYSVNINFNRYIVDIRMKKYSVNSADKLFRAFTDAVSYPYSHITVRYNEEKRVRYRLCTCKEDKTGVYMDVIISGLK